MHKINVRRGAVAIAVAALASVASALAAGPAQAAPGATPSTTDSAAVTSAAATSGTGGGRFQANSPNSYWTADRMRSARPAQAPADAAKAQQSTRQATGAPGSTPAAAGRSTTNLPAGAAKAMGLRADEFRPMVNASPTVGKVFFRNPTNGLDYVCSASTVNSGSKLLVITAGHCVHGGRDGQWMQNWIFVPLYNYGYQPYGSWSAKWFTTFNSWISDSNLDRDVGFVTVWPNGSGRVVDVVGGNGLSWNYSYNEYVTILAYPQDPPYDGGWQQYCTGTTDRPGFWPFLENKIELHCGFTGGSSGAPWLRVYNGYWGNVNGVMSTLNSGGWNKSPYFDDSVHNVFVSVADRT